MVISGEHRKRLRESRRILWKTDRAWGYVRRKEEEYNADYRNGKYGADDAARLGRQPLKEWGVELDGQGKIHAEMKAKLKLITGGKTGDYSKQDIEIAAQLVAHDHDRQPTGSVNWQAAGQQAGYVKGVDINNLLNPKPANGPQWELGYVPGTPVRMLGLGLPGVTPSFSNTPDWKSTREIFRSDNPSDSGGPGSKLMKIFDRIGRMYDEGFPTNDFAIMAGYRAEYAGGTDLGPGAAFSTGIAAYWADEWKGLGEPWWPKDGGGYTYIFDTYGLKVESDFEVGFIPRAGSREKLAAALSSSSGGDLPITSGLLRKMGNLDFGIAGISYADIEGSAWPAVWVSVPIGGALGMSWSGSGINYVPEDSNNYIPGTKTPWTLGTALAMESPNKIWTGKDETVIDWLLNRWKEFNDGYDGELW